MPEFSLLVICGYAYVLGGILVMMVKMGLRGGGISLKRTWFFHKIIDPAL